VSLLRGYGLERIILLGSEARGEGDEYSDYDVIMIKRTQRCFPETLRDMLPYLVEFGRPVEIFVYSPEESKRLRENAASLREALEASLHRLETCGWRWRSRRRQLIRLAAQLS